MMGVPTFRSVIALKSAKLYDCKVDPETEITVTSDATEALFAAISSVVRSGDEVIIFDPVYDSYGAAIARM